MNLYAFELGRKKALCHAELLAVNGADKLVEKNIDASIFELDLADPQAFQDKLGGTIKIVEILRESSKATLQNDIEEILNKELAGREGKVLFAVSTLNFNRHSNIDIKKTLKNSKIFLKSLGLSCRFVNKGPVSPKPSTIFKARVIEKGIDINIIKSEKGILLGKTVSTQNIAAYGSRDYDKPGRDARVGMLPPKLAQIMLNLAGDSKTVYDPFCGTGTVLMEALLMDKTALGSDLNPRMAKYAQLNCNWLNAGKDFRIFERDAQYLTREVLPEQIDTIVTEGYLGEPQSSLPSPEKQEEIFRELANLHLNWLRAAHPLLPNNGKIVMCVTAFQIHGKLTPLPRFKEIAETAGFKVLDTFIYNRPDQIVSRDIKILQKI